MLWSLNCMETRSISATRKLQLDRYVIQIKATIQACVNIDQMGTRFGENIRFSNIFARLRGGSSILRRQLIGVHCTLLRAC
ncbi:hypothetical protein AQUCO_00600007v1 [Aquilegia coerulea]|uniref:Uncharacterized protein n=1 Tax=Aquilegia coerulea TaxID=218851 RepID=A0A2G5EMJ4_AQUCA|nr:hypothetical protein AQUCO_00600007v1 [Aquilegia coerulea]